MAFGNFESDGNGKRAAADAFPPIFDWRAEEELETEAVWQALCDVGALQLRLPAKHRQLNQEMFTASAAFFSAPPAHRARYGLRAAGERAPRETSQPPPAPPKSAAGIVNGFHEAGGLSAYNRFRTGFIFQGDELWDLSPPMDSDRGPSFASPPFLDTAIAWREACRSAAAAVLRCVAKALQLGESDANAFCRGHSYDVFTNSQWHLKRTLVPCATSSDESHGNESSFTNQREVRLPAHRDPSVVSLIIHDDVSYRKTRHDDDAVVDLTPGGQGLELQADEFKDADERGHRNAPQENPKTVFPEMPFREISVSGCGVATVVAGELLARLTGGLVADVRHRVVLSPAQWPAQAGCHRTAATFFFQPCDTLWLRPLTDSPAVAAHIAGFEKESSDERTVMQHRKYERYCRFRKSRPVRYGDLHRKMYNSYAKKETAVV